MTIKQYLLEKHLKPLFIFKLNDKNSSECFGIFVGSKGKDSTNVNFGDLIWDHKSVAKPSWFNETPLWIIPLSKEKEKDLYSLRYNDPKFPNNDLVLPKQFNSCYISIVEQEKGPDWDSYVNLKPDEPLKFSHYLNFEGSELTLSVETPFTRHSISDKEGTVTVWLTDADKILTSTKLLNFNGIQCDIVDAKGTKHDFGIWLGIRDNEDNKEDKQSKIVLSINSLNNSARDQFIGTDCPIVWRQEGLLDDTIFPVSENTYNIESTNNFLLKCRDLAEDDDISRIIIYLAGLSNKPKLNLNAFYSWFIKEKLFCHSYSNRR